MAAARLSKDNVQYGEVLYSGSSEDPKQLTGEDWVAARTSGDRYAISDTSCYEIFFVLEASINLGRQLSSF